MTTLNPFLGARPYGPADDVLFFGREAATAALAERICLRPLTILTAPSGIGKTSLLRAAVLPELERDGLCAAYMRVDPGADGDAAAALLGDRLLSAIASALLSGAAEEQRCLRIVRANTAAATLGEARAWFAALPPKHELRRELFDTRDSPVDCLPLLARCLRGTLEPEGLGAQLARLGAPAGPVTAATTLDALGEMLGDPRLADGLLDAQTRLRTGQDDAGAITAIRRLTQGDEATRPLLARGDGDEDLAVRIVLVLDQFEQLFTMAPPATRARALALLGALLGAGLDLHLVLSMRKEWYADLLQQWPQLNRASDTTERTTFHLLAMTREEARQVMVEAPLRTDVPPIAPDQQSALWDGLQQDGSIDAVALSIACHELFAADGAEGGALAAFDAEALLRAYLVRALAGIDDPADRDEAMDMLGEIAGSEVSRSFVTQSRLLEAPLRNVARRNRVLLHLQRAFLIKGDSPRRGFDKVYDIMHERLLGSVRQHIANHPRIAAFRDAAERLAKADQAGLDWGRCQALLNGWLRLSLDSRAAGLLVRSLVLELSPERIAAMPASDAEHPNDRLRAIFQSLVRAIQAGTPGVAMAERARLQWWLTPAEIHDRLAEAPDGTADGHALISALRGQPGGQRSATADLAQRIAGLNYRPPPAAGLRTA